MLPSSVIVIVATALLTLGAALLLFWAWHAGFFRDFDAQSRVILNERDFRLERPWESTQVRTEREREHGELVPPVPGEWGGAA
jgi:nitrogen fixation-related uncharacterized protein